MMGTKIRSFSPLPLDVSLEELVPKDDFYTAAWGGTAGPLVREGAGGDALYAKGGRPSVDPVVFFFFFFELRLVMFFFEDLRSERQLMRVVAYRLSVRWYLGYDLQEGPLPDHSSLTRSIIRDRLGSGVFRSFFERIVEECVDAGLVWGEELFFDATKVEANASIDSTRSRSVVEGRPEEHLVEVFPELTPRPPRKETSEGDLGRRPRKETTRESSSPASWGLRATEGEGSRERTRF